MFTRIIFILLYIFYFISISFQSNLWGNMLSPIVTLIAAAYVFQGFCLNEKRKYLKVSGLLLASSIFSWAVCDIVWGIDDLILKVNPEKSLIISYGYSLTNLLISGSLFISGFQQIKKWNVIQFFLDTVTISVCIMLLIWEMLFNGNINNIVMLNNNLNSSLSISCDILILIWTFIVFLSNRKTEMHLSIAFTLLGQASFAGIDIFCYYQEFYNKYNPNSLTDGVYVTAFVLIAIGAILKMRANRSRNIAGISSNGRNRKGIVLICAPILIIVSKGIQVHDLFITSFIIIVYYIFSTYIQNNIYKDELILKEKELNEKLEQTVADRTNRLTQKNKELKYLLNRDVITGLYNRRYFLSWLKKELPQLGQHETVLLLYIELNKYKMIKTMFGNYIGDEALREMSDRLKKYSDSFDNTILVYYGEDSFIISKKDSFGYEEGHRIAEEIINLISDIYKIQDYEIRVTVNIGISIYPFDAKKQEDLIKHADVAMLQSSMHGFNKAMSYDEKLGELIYRKNRIEIMLKKANYNDEFMLFYQPQVNIEDKKLVGFEALIRWKTAKEGFISPAEFIPIAEQTGLIIPIGDWVMRKALSQLAYWNSRSDMEIKMSINVSVKQLNGTRFINNLREEMKRLAIQPECVDIEITESIELEQNLEIKDMLQEFRNMGISISIDDFGTGYSSLYYLKNLPIDRIKIAKQLIDYVCENEFDYEIVKSVISIAKVRGIRVIAEGVELEEQWNCLDKLNCNEVQGYFIGKPMPPEAIYEELSECCEPNL
ncbi:putative bifunctional diguanylate cyclase/phosphodiesterase [Clostridium oryzae]|nr:bifunctional diguanylate cyclase/phosphodiesterase [Clostridium oryzae]